MMGIYIKGIGMPISIEKPLEIKIYPNGDVYCRNRGYGGWRAVPVHPHGRLIDADALEALFWDGQCYFTENIKYKIKNIETIFPAEEGET